jgi:phosphatidylserine/phosphatidylglycerophosphate/cardiolipin synthase-like enzyme
MKLLVQPGDSIAPLVNAINGAQKCVDIVIFRFDRGEMARALTNAVQRGVLVHALIAHKNHAGDDGLRRLEMQLLAAGVMVSRTASDLPRYHGKMMIVDERELYLLGFNLTYIDIERSRSFGVVTTDAEIVEEALRLFEADCRRSPYATESPSLIVSPVNARTELTKYIRQAERELLIYDPQVSDPAMIRLLQERSKAGVDVRLLGGITITNPVFQARKLSHPRLHTRTMIRDQETVFLGSQSLREVELDGRREVGILFADRKVAGQIGKIFESDWTASKSPAEIQEVPVAARAAKKIAKAVAKDLPPMSPIVDRVVREVSGEEGSLELDTEEVQRAVQDAVKESVKQVVRQTLEEISEEH